MEFRPAKAHFLASIAVLLGVFTLQGARGIRSESATFDEPTAIGSSYLAFRTGDLRIMRERPPLLGLFVTPALRLAGEPRLPPVPDPDDRLSDVRFGDALFHAAGNDPVEILRVSRSVNLALSLGLGALVALWAWQLGGAWRALLSAFLFAFCPNLLAHSRIAANDMISAVFVTFALYALWLFRRSPRYRYAALCAAALGTALASKLSAILILPLYGGVWYLTFRGLRDKSEQDRRLAQGGVILAGAFLVLGACLGGRFDYPAYFEAFSKIYTGTVEVYPFYLGGDVSFRPWWYYHLYAAAIKTPVPLLLLAALGTATAFRERPKQAESALFLWAPVALFLAASFFDRTNIGLRRILPVYPFLILLASGAARVALTMPAKAALFSLLCLWQAASVLRVGRHHLAYFNEIVGGPSRGLHYLDDSNIDWGQELPGLKAWADARPGLDLRLKYFGTARPATYGLNLPEMKDAEICAPDAAVYAVSAHDIVFFEKLARLRGTPCSWLRRYRPVDRIGYSILIYDFRDSLRGAPRVESEQRGRENRDPGRRPDRNRGGPAAPGKRPR